MTVVVGGRHVVHIIANDKQYSRAMCGVEESSYTAKFERSSLIYLIMLVIGFPSCWSSWAHAVSGAEVTPAYQRAQQSHHLVLKWEETRFYSGKTKNKTLTHRQMSFHYKKLTVYR